MGAGTNGANPMASISVLTELLGVGSWAPTLGMTALVPAMRAGGLRVPRFKKAPDAADARVNALASRPISAIRTFEKWYERPIFKLFPM
jgi:hypothetical protein